MQQSPGVWADDARVRIHHQLGLLIPVLTAGRVIDLHDVSVGHAPCWRVHVMHCAGVYVSSTLSGAEQC